MERDQWENALPPSKLEGFTGEAPSRVFHYYNGSVSEAGNMRWVREPGQEGRIFDISGRWILNEFGTGTVFDCGGFLPCIFRDGDPTVSPSNYFALHFVHGEGGVSEASIHGHKYIAGRHASWLGSLVPSNYINQRDGIPRSRGLRGPMVIILGLMGLTQQLAEDAFVYHHWTNHRWNGQKNHIVCTCLHFIAVTQTQH